jgi:ribosomal-protein-serine acetyltransferase
MTSDLFEIKISESLSLVIPNLNRASEIFSLIDKDRAHLREWLPWVDSATNTVEDSRNNLAERIKGFSKKKQASFLGTLNGEIVASVGFISLGDNQGEIGYWLLSKYGGKGLMTFFVEACIEYGFNTLNLNTIVIKCAERNTKSAGVPKRLGFTQSGKIEPERIRNGSKHSTLVFSLTREDWSK